MSDLRIVGLIAENVKRVRAVEIRPDESNNMIVIGGRNAQGKSSVIDSIALALGGKELAPPEPIRYGETTARIELDLGEFSVIRQFKRERLEDAINSTASQISGTTVMEARWGPTTSNLIVRTKDNAKYASPQSMLDGLLNGLSLDPLAFIREQSRKQREILQQLVGFDEKPFDERRTKIRTERTRLQSLTQDVARKFSAAPHFPNAPTKAVDFVEVLNELQRAEVAQETLQVGLKHQAAEQQKREGLRENLTETKRTIQDLEQRLKTARESEVQIIQQLNVSADRLAEHDAAVEKHRADLLDTESIRKKLTALHETNGQIELNVRRAELQAQFTDLENGVKAQTRQLSAIEGEKADALARLAFPVPGLGFSDVGVTMNGVPFEQASMSEKLRVSIAIGLALHPKLKVLLVREGNVLDDEALQTLAKLAAEQGAQVWLEYVTSNPNDPRVSVVIEDGAIL